MRKQSIRVVLKLAKDAETDLVLAAAEQALGRPITQLCWVRGAGVLSFPAEPGELQRLQTLPGVLRVGLDGCAQLPPQPRREKV